MHDLFAMAAVGGGGGDSGGGGGGDVIVCGGVKLEACRLVRYRLGTGDPGPAAPSATATVALPDRPHAAAVIGEGDTKRLALSYRLVSQSALQLSQLHTVLANVNWKLHPGLRVSCCILPDNTFCYTMNQQKWRRQNFPSSLNLRKITPFLQSKISTIICLYNSFSIYAQQHMEPVLTFLYSLCSMEYLQGRKED